MTRLRAIAFAAVAMTLVPSVAAAPLGTALRLEVQGAALVDGPAEALFVLADAHGFSWDATAASVKLERTWCDTREVLSQETPGGAKTPRFSTCQHDPQTETLTFREARLSGLDAPLGSALLVTSLSEAPLLHVDAPRGLTILPEQAPRADQGRTSNVDEGDEVDWEIHEALPGPTLNLTAVGGGTVEMRGTFLLRPSGVSYRIASPEGTTDARTGQWRTSSTPFTAEGRVERNVLILEDAVLTLRTTGAAHAFSQQPVLSLGGALRAEGADGDWTGLTTLALGVDGGRVALADGGDVAAASTMRVARTPPVLAWALGLLAAVGGIVAVVLVARRRREDPGDALEMALLAMEDHRYGDALPHLERALRARPDDADLLVDRALCLEQTGRLNEARDAYEAALRHAPFNAEAHYYYARTLARLRNSTAALAHLARALALDARLLELAQRESAFLAYRDHPQFLGLLG